CSHLFSQNTVTQYSSISEEELRQCVKELYDSQVGVREVGGENRGVSVEMYLESVGLGRSLAWCAAFVSWCYQHARVEAPKSGWVPSYALQRKRIYQRGKFQKQKPQSGDVFMIWYHKLNRPAHIGFVDHWGDKWVITVEGNTNDNGSREGDGVYRKRRLKKQVWAVSDFITTNKKQSTKEYAIKEFTNITK
ncbi:CHAP domain-containing protein, partial [Aquimarina algiphila]